MKVSELKERKKELGYSNEKISELSGVPLGTVQKIFGGATETPRYETLKKLEKVLFPEYGYMPGINYDDVIRSSSTEEPVAVRDSVQLANYGYNNVAFAGKRQGEYTIDDWFALPDGVRMELIDGRLYDMAPASYTHQHFVTQLSFEIEAALRKEKKRRCIVLVAPFGVQLNKDKKNMLEPDVAITCSKEKFDRERGIIYGAPDFVAEGLSPSTAGYDRILKLNKYWMGGVREYWIIDTNAGEIMVYHFEKGSIPELHTYEDTVPIGISDGLIEIDFKAMMERLQSFLGDDFSGARK